MRVGNILLANPGTGYGITNEDGLYMIVMMSDDCDNIRVKVIAHKYLGNLNAEYPVNKNNFTICDNPREVIAQHPDWVKVRNFDELVATPEEVAEIATNHFNWGEPHHFTDEEIEDVTRQIYNKISDYGDYAVTMNGCRKIAKTWGQAMAPLIGAMEKDPDYNGRYQIAKDVTLERNVDKEVIREVMDRLNEESYNFILEKANTTYDWLELNDYIEKLKWMLNAFDNAEYRNVKMSFLHYKTRTDVSKALAHFRAIKEKYEYYRVCNNMYVTEDSYLRLIDFRNVISKFRHYYEATISQDFSDQFYRPEIDEEGRTHRVEIYEDVEVPVGAKTSRVFLKICRKFGAEKCPEFDREWRIMYGDAINPLEYKRWTILSAHPVDYLTMSNGTNWSTCQNPDKYRDDYHGMYMSGTLSYMLDASTLVLYTLDEKYDGTTPELEAKEIRQLFHIGEDKVIQGRYYPYDQTDRGRRAEPEDYVQFRNIVQNLVSNMFNVPNDWKLRRGTCACDENSSHTGTHYRDITHYENCNVSTLRGTENTNKIKIGHAPICPSCGYTHSQEGDLNCYSCTRDDVECQDCGCSIPRDEAYSYDGEYFCSNCVTYCSYHDRYEPNEYFEFTEVENYGWVCDDALENSERFVFCNECSEWRVDDNAVYIEDGYTFCSAECAINAGYIFNEEADGWVQANEDEE